MIEYRLVRSRRKTISLQITMEGEVLVRAPMRCAKRQIDQFVASKEDWIVTHQAQVQEALKERQEFRLQEGDTIPFMGRPMTVHFRQGNLAAMDVDMGTIRLPEVDMEQLRPRVAELYQKYGLPLLRRRLHTFAGEMGVSYEDVKMSSAVRRWGSCSRTGRIRISWYLLMAPERAIDYVLIHELAHRKHFDHSRAFWATVETYMPDYRKQKEALRETQEQLFSQGWSKL